MKVCNYVDNNLLHCVESIPTNDRGNCYRTQCQASRSKREEVSIKPDWICG
jgi:hypothetical protein